MKTFIVFSAILAVSMAGLLPPHAPASQSNVVVLKGYSSDNIGRDGYNFGYELSDGQKRDESGHVEASRSGNEEEAILRVEGSFSWVNPEDGQTYGVTYVADENGFQPKGAHLPVAPTA